MSEFCEGCDREPEGVQYFEPGEWLYCPYCGSKLVTLAEHSEALREELGERAAASELERVRDLGEHVYQMGTAMDRVMRTGVKGW